MLTYQNQMAAPPPYNQNGQYPPAGQNPPPPRQYHATQPAYPPLQEKGRMPPGYPQQPPQHVQNLTTIITAQPAIVVGAPIMFHEFPVSLTCPSCQAQVISAVQYEAGSLAWLLCVVIFFV